MIPLKAAISVLGAWMLAVVDTQPYFVLGAFVVTIVLGWRAFKVREWSGEITGLKAAIDTHETIKKTDDELIKQLREQLNGAQARANAAELEMREWKAAHDALKPYSAGPAFEKLEQLMSRMATAGDKRHAETIDLIRRLAGEKSVTD